MLSIPYIHRHPLRPGIAADRLSESPVQRLAVLTYALYGTSGAEFAEGCAGTGDLLAGAGGPDRLVEPAEHGIAGSEVIKGGAFVTAPPADLPQGIRGHGLPSGVAGAGAHLPALGEHARGAVEAAQRALLGPVALAIYLTAREYALWARVRKLLVRRTRLD
ncbi:hypothetical protein [Microtetraspora fusca]|uniref:hypothetical protein n=1 Tax=Microtetraspora fusca TaxID=1997 RepID=UPI0012FA20A0|nr:hypothetical protein [Microtetraspora fusca]